MFFDASSIYLAGSAEERLGKMGFGKDHRPSLIKLSRTFPRILGASMRNVKEIKEAVLSRAGRYRDVHPDGNSSEHSSQFQAKEA